MNKRWKEALDRARSKWASATPDERRQLTAELDVVWDELAAERGDDPPPVGPRFCSPLALVGSKPPGTR